MNELLQEILAAREQRAQTQQALLQEYGLPLVCFTMNIPGPVKDSPLIRRAFDAGCALLEKQVANIRFRNVSYANTGCEAFYVVDADAGELKKCCTAIEESCPLGRLFDMDVLSADGRKLERETQRGCMVCGKPGRFCAASRAHNVAVLQETTRRILKAHFSAQDAKHVANLAVQALLAEVHVTPKPGLVDENNTGSHKDMDIALFAKSANALMPYFQRCVTIGQLSATLPAKETFFQLRLAGRKAEEEMYEATGGINTHKGAIYTLGILCGSIGRLWRSDAPMAATGTILQEAAAIAAYGADLSAIRTPHTAGEELYIRHGLTGIRGEAAAGFPSIAGVGLPAYRQALENGKSSNDAAAEALIHLIAQVEDTNLYHRGGPEGAAYAKQAAKDLLPSPTTDDLLALDKAFIDKNLSPGGCADLLAATIFLHTVNL